MSRSRVNIKIIIALLFYFIVQGCTPEAVKVALEAAKKEIPSLAAYEFIILDPPDSYVGADVKVIIQAKTSTGAVVTGFDENVILNLSGSATGGGIVNIYRGEGFRYIKNKVAEKVVLTLSSIGETNLLTNSRQEVNFLNKPARKYTIVKPLEASVGGTSTVTVRAEDEYGNIDYRYQTDIGLAVSGNATGDGIVNIINGKGEIILTNQISENVTLSLIDAFSSGLDVSSTQSLYFWGGSVVKYVIVNPNDSFVGDVATVTIQAQNSNGFVDGNYQRDVILNISGSATGGGLVDIVNGIGIALISNTVAENVTLSLSNIPSLNANVSSVQDLIFIARPATKIVILPPAITMVGNSASITVQAQDQYGNIDSSYNMSSAVILLANGSATVASGGVIDLVDGEGTIIIDNLVAETVTLSLTDQATSLDVTDTQTLGFSSSVATQFVIINPAGTTVGIPSAVKVQAQDQYGNRVLSYSGYVRLNTNKSAIGGGVLHVKNGEGTLSINDQVAETITCSLQDTYGTGLVVASTQDLIFTTGPVARFNIPTYPSQTVGSQPVINIQALDQYGNIAALFSGLVTVVSEWENNIIPDVVTFSSGVGSFVMGSLSPITSVSTWSVRVVSSYPSNVQQISFIPASASSFTIEDPPNTSVGYGTVVVVKVQDSYGNTNSNYQNDVTLKLSGSVSGADFRQILVNIINGIGYYSFTHQVIETIIFTLSDTLGTGLSVVSTQDVVYMSNAASKFVIRKPPNTTVGQSCIVGIDVQDVASNLVPSYQNDVTLLVTGSAVGGGLINVVNGKGSTVINNLVAENVNLSLSDTQGTGLNVASQKVVTFLPDRGRKLIIRDPTDGPANTPINVILEVQDQYGNVDTSFSRTPAVTLKASGSATPNSSLANIVNGTGTVSLNNAVVEAVNLTLSNSQYLLLDTSSTQNVIFGADQVTQFVIINPVDTVVGTSSPITIQAQDQFGNVNLSYNQLLAVTLNFDQQATGGGDIDIQNGVGISSINYTVAQTVNLSLSNSVDPVNISVASTQDIVFQPGLATKIVIADPPNPKVREAAVVTVQIHDLYDNVVDSYNGSVTLNVDKSAIVPNGGVVNIVSGIGTIVVNDDVVEEVNLSLTDSLPTGLNVSNTQKITFWPPAVSNIDNALYVSITGSDAQATSGSPWSPLRTISAAISRASVNSEVRVSQGVYDVGNLVVVKAGISLVGGYSTDWVYRDITTYPTQINHTATSMSCASDNICSTILISGAEIDQDTRIDGFYINGPDLSPESGSKISAAIFVHEGAAPTITNNIIKGRGNGEGVSSYALALQGEAIVYNNYIEAGTVGAYTCGICSWNNATIRNNTINGGSGSLTSGIWVISSNGLIIENNIVYTAGGASRFCVREYYSNTDVSKLRNNNLFDCPEGLYLDEGNLVRSTPGEINNQNNTTQTGSGTSVDNISVDLVDSSNTYFVNESSNWALTSAVPLSVTSGGIDGGPSGENWGFSSDYLGVNRTGDSITGWSIGAFEKD